MRKLVYLIFLIMVLFVSALTPPPSQALLQQISNKEIQSERTITNLLNKYYSSESFIVTVSVDRALSINSRIIPKIDTTIKQLPGLPTIPHNLRSQTGALSDTLYDTSFVVGAINLSIVVDTSYSFDDFSFIRENSRIALHLDESAGDNITVTRKMFPRMNRELRLQEPVLDTPIVDSTPMITPAAPVAPTKSFPWLLLLIIILLLLIALLLFRKRKHTHQSPSLIQENDELREALTTIIKKVDAINAPVAPEATKEIEDLQTYIVATFISNSTNASLIFKSWMEALPQQGIINSAHLIKHIDPTLFSTISNQFSVEEQRLMQWHINNSEFSSDEKLLELLRQYKSDFLIITKDQADLSSDIFNFLTQLTDEQIMHLIQKEENGIIAVVIAQLSPEQASRILQKLEPTQRTSILAHIGQISKIPITSYKRLAQQLSKKALQLGNMRYVTSDGISKILDFLFSLPTSEQDSYLNSLAEVDLQLVQKIKRFFVSFDELVFLPNDLLRPILLKVDRSVLTISLVNCADTTVQQLTKVLPERMQQMVFSDLQTQQDSSLQEIERARRALLKQAHFELKSRGGREL